jgi:hypothetical protein
MPTRPTPTFCFLGFGTIHKCPSQCKGTCGYAPIDAIIRHADCISYIAKWANLRAGDPQMTPNEIDDILEGLDR